MIARRVAPARSAHEPATSRAISRVARARRRIARARRRAARRASASSGDRARAADRTARGAAGHASYRARPACVEASRQTSPNAALARFGGVASARERRRPRSCADASQRGFPGRTARRALALSDALCRSTARRYRVVADRCGRTGEKRRDRLAVARSRDLTRSASGAKSRIISEMTEKTASPVHSARIAARLHARSRSRRVGSRETRARARRRADRCCRETRRRLRRRMRGAQLDALAHASRRPALAAPRATSRAADHRTRARR